MTPRASLEQLSASALGVLDEGKWIVIGDRYRKRVDMWKGLLWRDVELVPLSVSSDVSRVETTFISEHVDDDPRLPPFRCAAMIALTEFSY